MAMGLSDGSRNVGLTFVQSTSLKWSPLTGYTTQYGVNVGANGSATDINSTRAAGLVSDSTKSGIVGKLSGISMNFYIKY